MTATTVLTLSIVLQVWVAYLALRMVRITGVSLAWIAISIAILLMVLRRSITLYRALSGNSSFQPDLSAELIALSISVLMLIGVARIAPLFRTLRDNQRVLEMSEADARQTTEQLEKRSAELNESNIALEESRAMLARVLDAIPVRVFWKDTNSVYLGCNKNFAHDAGLDSPQEMIGKDDYAQTWKDQAELYRSDDKQVMSSGQEKINFEEPQTTPDGGQIYLRTSKIPLKDRDGRVYGILGCYEDITEEKKAEHELRQHREHLEELVKQRTQEVQLQAQIIDQIHDSVVSTDLDGAVTSWNKGAERLFQYKAEEAVGKPISFVYPEEEHQYLQERVIEPLKRKGEHECEVRMRRKDGQDFYAQLASSMLTESGVPKGMIGYSMDITARKRAEFELLENRDELAAANMELEAFSYSVSHDLRTPLRAIDGFSHLLLEDYSDRLDQEGQEHLRRIRSGAQYMAKLIDDLLELARMGRYELNVQPVNLAEVARTTIAKLQAAEPDRQVEVVIEDDIEALGDLHLLSMVISNLLGNAWKYTGKSESPRIEFGVTRENGEDVYFVRDNGVGFNMEYVDKLFGTFQRLHGKEFEGTGIGLATVQRIIRRHGGKVWAKSREHEGATFYFNLPARSLREQGAAI
jgi:PAS domain S-box-containing protein